MRATVTAIRAAVRIASPPPGARDYATNVAYARMVGITPIRKVLSCVGVGLVLLSLAATAAASSPSPALKAQKAKVAKLQAQIAKVKRTDAVKIAALKTQLSAANTSTSQLTTQVATLNAQVAALIAQVTAQAAGGVAAIIAGGPPAEWAAVQQIWAVFPLMPSGSFCGFDKSSDLVSGTGLNITRYDFVDYTNC